MATAISCVKLIMKMENQFNKDVLRTLMKEKRNSLSYSRYMIASETGYQVLLHETKSYGCVLSFATCQSELDTWKLNQALASEGRLLLPRVDGCHLRLYQVSCLLQHLKISSLGILEPIPEMCPETHLTSIELALVPGLAFDRHKHRLGYGKGYYDRLLSQLKPEVPTWGIGFVEQGMNGALPVTSNDVALSDYFLF